MNKIEKLFLCITSTLFFLSMFLMGFSFVCHAQGLPYLIDNDSFVNSDGYSYEDLVDFYNGRWSTYPLDFSSGVIIYEYIESNITWTTVYVPESSSATYKITLSKGYNDFDTDSDYATVEVYGYSKIDFSNANYWGSNYYANPRLTRSSNVSSGGFTFYLFHNGYTPLFANSQFMWFVDDSKTVFGYDDDITIPVVSGHAVAPSNDPNNFINGLNGSPITRPNSPTINNYTWNTWTSPNIDTSSIESLLESLIDVVTSLLSWLGFNISGEFNNLISNLQSLFNYLVQTIENGFNKVVSSIQGLATDIYNNFVSLFEPIFNHISEILSYIIQPVDLDLIQSEVESTSLMSDYSEVVFIKDSFVSVFTDTTEPSSFTIPIHLENLSMLNIGTQYIDLSVINPVKSALRTFIWVIVSFGLVVTIIDSIPNYINGGGDE